MDGEVSCCHCPYSNSCYQHKICYIKCSSLKGDDEDGAQTIKWIHLNLQTFATIDYPLVTRINGLWSPILVTP